MQNVSGLKAILSVTISDQVTHLQADFSDGTSDRFADVDALVERLYELGIQPEQVTAADWHEDIDQAPSSGTKIALLYGLRKRYMEALQERERKELEDFMNRPCQRTAARTRSILKNWP